ncbi:MAG: hypothetical protein EBT35_11225, partial [Alphaproteobacteria bacterium]|nr:hypothetical protein [Alphaproteobacteria bacterium]
TGSSVYGSTLLPGAVTLSGVVNGDSVSTASVVINTTGLLSGGGQLKVGSHLGIQSVSGVLSGAGAANYTFAGASGNYTVTPKTLTGLISARNSEYGANLVNGTVSLSGLVSGDNVIPDNTVSIALAAANQSTSGYLKAGSYTGIQTAPATLTGTDIANYTYSGATGDYTVSKATLGGSISPSSSVYGSALVPGAATITTGIVSTVTGTDVVTAGTVSVTTAGNTSTSGKLKAGTYPNKQTLALNGADADNYTFAGTVGDYTVSRLALAGVLGAGSSAYGASLVPGAVTFSNKVTGDIVTTATPTVNTSGKTSSSGNLIAGTHNGIQSVSGALSGLDADNYTFTGATANYTVTPLALVGVLGAGSSVYGAALVPGSVTFTNKVTGDNVLPAAVVIDTTGKTSTSGNLKANTYTELQTVSSVLSGTDALNYTFAGVKADYTVSKATLGGSISPSSSVYGSALVPGTATITTGIVSTVTGTDIVTTGTVSVTPASNTSTSGKLKAGTYSQTLTLNGADKDNYTFTDTPGNYIVTPLELTGVIGAGSTVYGATLVPGAVTFSNKVDNDVVTAATPSINISGKTSTSGKLNAGSYTGIQSVGSTLSGADAANYSFSGATGNYEVSKLVLNGSIGDSSSYYSNTLV